MATITSNGSGDWTAGGTWVGGVSPAGGSGGDDAVIAKNHVVTLDATTCVCKSLTLNVGTTGADVGGKLTAANNADTKLVVYNGITENGSNSGATAGAFSGIVDIDLSASTYKCEIYTNGAAATNNSGTVILQGKINLKGRTKTRWTLTSGALTGNSTKSIGVADATGWQVGDKLIFATTQAYNATPRTDLVTIATLTFDSGSTGPATVTWTDGAGTGGAVAYAHDTSCLVGNFHSNLIFGPVVANSPWAMRVECAARNTSGTIQDVEFRSPGANATFGYSGIVSFYGALSGVSFSRNALYDFGGVAVYHFAQNGDTPKTDNVYYTTRTGTEIAEFTTQAGSSGNETNMAVFRCATGVVPASPGYRLINPMISGCTSRAIYVGGYGDARIEGGGIWSCNAVNYHSQGVSGTVNFDQTWLGKGFSGATYSSANNAYISVITGPATTIYTSCPENLSGGSRIDATGGSDTSEVAFFNKNNDAAQQEIYRTKYDKTNPVFVRDSSVTSNANASMRIDTLGASTTFSKTFQVLAKAGEALTLFVYARKNAAFNDGTNTRPTATLSGLGITPITATMTDVDDTWEKLDLSYVAGLAPSADGQLTLTLSCQSSTATAKAYFSGLPIVPYVTRCRHYGYLFDETSMTRTVDAAKSAAFATADAYTGISITWGSTSSTDITGNTTFQKLYDYHQAKATQNVGSAVALTGAGVAGSPSLFAAGDVETTGYTLNGAGSLAMGENTLTGSIPFAYTYTGGTFSQASTVPSFSGGTLTIPTKITDGGNFSMTGAEIEFGAAGSDWNFSDVLFSGTITLSTTAGQSVTVAMPAGVTVDNTEPGNITVTAPVVVTNVLATVLANTRMVLVNVTDSSTEIDNILVAGTAYSYEITTEAADGDVLDLFYFKEGYVEGKTRFVWGAATQTVSVDQATDPAIQYYRTEESITDYTTLTEFDFYAPDIYIRSDDPDGATALKRLFIFYNGALTTEEGARHMRGGVTFRSPFDVVINRSVVPLAVDNVSATLGLYFTDESTIRVTTDDGTRWIAPPSAPGSISYAFGVSPGQIETGVSGLTGPESAQLMSLPSAAAIANEVVNGVTFP